MLAVHILRNAMVTVLLSQRRVSPASETKLGKAPKDVEYVGKSPPHSPLSVMQQGVVPCLMMQGKALWTLAWLSLRSMDTRINL